MRTDERGPARTGGARQPIREPCLVRAQTFATRDSLPHSTHMVVAMWATHSACRSGFIRTDSTIIRRTCMANTMRSRVVAGAVACAMSIAPFAGTTVAMTLATTHAAMAATAPADGYAA